MGKRKSGRGKNFAHGSGKRPERKYTEPSDDDGRDSDYVPVAESCSEDEARSSEDCADDSKRLANERAALDDGVRRRAAKVPTVSSDATPAATGPKQRSLAFFFTHTASTGWLSAVSCCQQAACEGHALQRRITPPTTAVAASGCLPRSQTSRVRCRR